MEIIESGIPIKKMLRVYSNESSSNNVLIALHGYGQLATFFIQKFESISDQWKIITPEATHRFYLNGTSGRVGASWMTREWRLQDIAEHQHMLDELYMSILSENPNAKIHLLGFSQGGATAARWVQYTKFPIQSLTLWASVFPPDLEGLTNSEAFNKLHKTFVLGTNDPYYSTDEQAKIIQFYKELGFKTVIFEGEHTIDQTVLKSIFKQIIV